jgi:hypothetical protein
MSSAPRGLILSPEMKRLKSACRRTVKEIGGTSLVAEECGIRQQRVSDCQLANTSDFFRLDEIHSLEEAARGAPGWPAVTRALARNHGFELMPMPAALDASPGWHQSIGAVAKETADVVAKISMALAGDNEVSASEICDGAIVEEIDEAIARLMVLRGRCTAALEGGAQ